ncbi:hypothetical protein RRG08_012633 [Elysia crispata]|uniref:Uncharacterized protein n=1 Tax=Elysia crispata TaxID=231223 RepID=A0AAE1D6N2_9GAST|nr:hypothetical protein RRG08_012633 [Elysia crispata]
MEPNFSYCRTFPSQRDNNKTYCARIKRCPHFSAVILSCKDHQLCGDLPLANFNINSWELRPADIASVGTMLSREDMDWC